MKLILLAVLLKICVSTPVSPTCQITSHTATSHGRDIDLTCEDDVKFSLKMTDKDGFSTLEVSGSKIEEEFRFLKVEHDGASNNMFLTLDGKRFDVKDDNTADESAALEDLLTNPNFSSFPAAVQLIHDELKLPGWKSPSIMFLYRIGMSLDDHHMDRRDARGKGWNRRNKIDRKILHYHGVSPKKECRYNGRTQREVKRFIEGECVGMCGRRCKSCWLWVCGDCCVHTGCLRHDNFCTAQDGSASYSNNACSSFRGVLWDTVTGTRRDC